MSTKRAAQARLAASAALGARATLKVKPWNAIDVFDCAQQAGIEVLFAKIPSMEGMYLRKSTPTILVGSERPSGRQRFTCAHEWGHHVFGDGSRVDELFDSDNAQQQRDEVEIRANMFAGMLLMPKSAVDRGFASRGLKPDTASPVEFFRVACWLGVGFATLANHLRYGLQAISDVRFRELDRCSPKQIRKALVGCDEGNELILVDDKWSDRPIDVSVNDLVLAPSGSEIEGTSCAQHSVLPSGVLCRAVTPGISRIELRSGWASFVRVSREKYAGRGIFRHLQEEEDE